MGFTKTIATYPHQSEDQKEEEADQGVLAQELGHLPETEKEWLRHLT